MLHVLTRTHRGKQCGVRDLRKASSRATRCIDTAHFGSSEPKYASRHFVCLHRYAVCPRLSTTALVRVRNAASWLLLLA